MLHWVTRESYLFAGFETVNELYGFEYFISQVLIANKRVGAKINWTDVWIFFKFRDLIVKVRNREKVAVSGHQSSHQVAGVIMTHW